MRPIALAGGLAVLGYLVGGPLGAGVGLATWYVVARRPAPALPALSAGAECACRHGSARDLAIAAQERAAVAYEEARRLREEAEL